jgi:hypothetical protein
MEDDVIGEDLNSYAIDLLDQGTKEDDLTKVRIGRILHLVAKAIQHGQVESLGRQVEWWARGNLGNGNAST